MYTSLGGVLPVGERPHISGDGRFVYWATADQLVSGDLDGTTSVYRYSLSTSTTSLAAAALTSDGRVKLHFVSRDGSKVFIEDAGFQWGLYLLTVANGHRLALYGSDLSPLRPEQRSGLVRSRSTKQVVSH